jgi:hypothetical protein
LNSDRISTIPKGYRFRVICRDRAVIRESGRLQNVTGLLFPPFLEFPRGFPTPPFIAALVQSDRPGVPLPSPDFSDRVVLYDSVEDKLLPEGGAETTGFFVIHQFRGGPPLRLPAPGPPPRDIILFEPETGKPSDLIRFDTFGLDGDIGLQIELTSDAVCLPETGFFQDITAFLFPDLAFSPFAFRDAPPIMVFVKSDLEVGQPPTLTLVSIGALCLMCSIVLRRKQSASIGHCRPSATPTPFLMGDILVVDEAGPGILCCHASLVRSACEPPTPSPLGAGTPKTI